MMLFPIDRQALFAAYERLESGDSEDDIEEKLLSRWSTIAGHFVMQGEFHEFGVSRQNMGIDDEPSFLDAMCTDRRTRRGAWSAPSASGRAISGMTRAEITVDLSDYF